MFMSELLCSKNINKSMNIEELVQNSVVKVYNNSIDIDSIHPWKIRSREQSAGSGYCIEINSKKFILTNAHCVAGSTLTRVLPYGQAQQSTAEIVFVMSSCDLAILDVDDPSFWEKLTPMSFTDRIPQALETVYVIGYPLGDACGHNISFTRGVVSRLVCTTYQVHGNVENIAIQVDAAINPGNSGGPVVDKKGNVVGTAFQGFEDADGIGEIIPVCVFKNLFLTYYNLYGHLPKKQRRLKADQLPELGISWQNMEADSLREYYQMSNDQSGILVTSVSPLSNLVGKIQPDDIIMEINGHVIESNGTSRFHGNQKIYLKYDHLVRNHPPNKPCQLKILRKGKTLDLEVIPKHVPKAYNDDYNNSNYSYFIVGGLVFISATIQYISQYVSDNNKMHPYMHAILFETECEEREHQFIFLSTILSHKINAGYKHKNFTTYPLTHFNGQKVKNLKHLSQLCDQCSGSYMKFEFKSNLADSKKILVLDTKMVRDHSKEILKNHLISDDRIGSDSTEN